MCSGTRIPASGSLRQVSEQPRTFTLSQVRARFGLYPSPQDVTGCCPLTATPGVSPDSGAPATEHPHLSSHREDGRDGEDQASHLSGSPAYWPESRLPSPCTPSPLPPEIAGQLQVTPLLPSPHLPPEESRQDTPPTPESLGLPQPRLQGQGEPMVRAVFSVPPLRPDPCLRSPG